MLCGGSNFCFAKIVHVIVGKYEQRAGYKRNSIDGNGPDSVLETLDLSC